MVMERTEPTRPQAKVAGKASLPVWKKLLFALLTLVMFFGLVELSLYIAGVDPLLYEEDPYVGFASQIPLFVEQDGAPPGDAGVQMVTARNKIPFFNKQQFRKEKQVGVTRVFCLGGSTTYGRPYDDATSFCGWLRELLPVADPTREWEVINAGGISYASYRVAALMEELSSYQPDIVIVYSGHNEFLERRTYSRIIETPASVRGLTALLSRTRTYSALSRTFRAEPSDDGQTTAPLAGEVNAILDQSIGPEDYERDAELKEQVLAHYRFNMSRIVDIARAGGAKVVLVTPASNLRHCSPFKSQHRDGLSAEDRQRWDALFADARESFEAERYAEALSDLDAAASIDDQYAGLHYLRGRVLDALKRYDDAKVAYRRAADEDVCPLRALSPMRDIVADVAEDRDVPLVDFDALVRDGSPQGIPGEQLFLDHVHPTIDGHRMLAVAIVDALAEQRWLALASDWNEDAVDGVAAKIRGKVDVKAQGVAMRNLSKVFSWAGKMEDAYRAAKKALALYPGDAESHYQVGNLAHQLGKTEEAIDHLNHLVSSDLKPEVSYYIKAHSQLAALQIEQGDAAAAERVLARLAKLDPDNPAGQQQQANLLKLQSQQLIKDGKLGEAILKLHELLRLRPDSDDARVQLAVALIRIRDYKSALPVLQQIVEARPKYLPAYDNLSFVLAQLGRLDEAERVCRKSLEIDPNHEAGRRNLQIILRQKAARE